jgi:hypothetical protein
MRRGLVLIVPNLVLAGVLAACGTAGTTRLGRTQLGPAKPSPQQFLRVHAARRAVEVTLIAGDGPSNNGFNFDDYGRGELLVSVPRGWKVTVHCKNASALRNSCAVVSGPRASRPAFRGASTPNPAQGLEQGQSASFSFVASRIGVYRVASVVPGHEQARMYVVLEVTRGGRPSISARRGP